MPNLEEVNFFAMSFTKDFSFLKNAKKLKKLSIIHGSTANLNFLNDIPSLEIFVLTDARETSFDFDFSKMKNLRAVSFAESTVDNSACLYSLPKNLEFLDLSNIRIKKLNFEKLRFIPCILFSYATTDEKIDIKKYKNVITEYSKVPEKFKDLVM